MNLSQALKKKNRLAGEIVRQQSILNRENARRSDSNSTVDRNDVWTKILTLSEELGSIKGKISTANIGIYPMLERMAELKSRISYISMLPKRDDVEVCLYGRDQEKTEYIWNSYIDQVKADSMISFLQEEINKMQDSVDTYNHNTEV